MDNIPEEYRETQERVNDTYSKRKWDKWGAERLVKERIIAAVEATDESAEVKEKVKNGYMFKVSCYAMDSYIERKKITRVKIGGGYRRERIAEIVSSKVNQSVDMARVVSLVIEEAKQVIRAEERAAAASVRRDESGKIAQGISTKDTRGVSIYATSDDASMVNVQVKADYTPEQAQQIVELIRSFNQQ